MEEQHLRYRIGVLRWGASMMQVICLVTVFFAFKEHDHPRAIVALLGGIVFFALEQWAVRKLKVLSR